MTENRAPSHGAIDKTQGVLWQIAPGKSRYDGTQEFAAVTRMVRSTH